MSRLRPDSFRPGQVWSDRNDDLWFVCARPDRGPDEVELVPADYGTAKALDPLTFIAQFQPVTLRFKPGRRP